MKGSMHSINLSLQHKDETIKELRLEIARLKIGGQPASKVRDMVLPVLKRIEDEISVGNILAMQKLANQLRMALGDNIPGDAEYKPAPKAHEAGVKPYKSLDHGPRDNEAAAPQYRFHQDQPDTLAAKAAAHRTKPR